MALVGTDRGVGSTQTSSASLAVVPASNFAAGMAVLCVAADNPTAGNDITGATDTKGNTWTVRQSPLIDVGNAATGHQGAILTTPQDVGLLTTGDTITVSFSLAKSAKTWTLMQVSSNAGGTVNYVTGNIGTGGTGSTSPTITTGTITSGNMVVAGLFLEAGTTETITEDGDSTNGAWSTQQTAEIGTTTSGSNIATQRKVVTATATQTYNPTLGILGDLALAWIELAEVLPVTGTLTTAFAKPSVDATGSVFSGFAGDAAVAFAKPDITASGTLTFTGTASASFAKPSVAATGAETFTGTASAAFAVPSVAGTGAETFTGTAVAAFAKPSVDATVAQTFTGTATAAFAKPSVSITGTTGGSVGTLAVAFAAPGIAGTGTNTPQFSGTLGIGFTVPSITLTGDVSSLSITGTAAVAFGAPSITLAGTTPSTNGVVVTPIPQYGRDENSRRSVRRAPVYRFRQSTPRTATARPRRDENQR